MPVFTKIVYLLATGFIISAPYALGQARVAAITMDVLTEQLSQENEKIKSSTIQLEFEETFQDYAEASESEFKKILDDERDKLEKKFPDSPDQKDRVLALEINLRRKIMNERLVQRDLKITWKGGKYRKDINVIKIKEAQSVPPALRNNPYVEPDNWTDPAERNQSISWDGKQIRIRRHGEDITRREIFLGMGSADSEVESLILLGHASPALISWISASKLTISQSDQTIDLNSAKDGSLVKLRLSSELDNAVIGYEIKNSDGNTSSAEFTEFSVIDGVRYPRVSVFKKERIFPDGVMRVVIVTTRRLIKGTFSAKIENETDFFSLASNEPTMIRDYNFEPALNYRSDGNEVSDVTVKALDATLNQIKQVQSVPVAGEQSASPTIWTWRLAIALTLGCLAVIVGIIIQKRRGSS